MMYQVKAQPKLLNVNRVPSQPKKRRKITLVFDEKKRRDFLKGFRKRKLERKQKAQEKLKQQLKEERKKIKQGVQEYYKNLVSSRDIPEIQQLLSQHEYETEGHTISILELNVEDLTENSTLIGENKGNVVEEDNEKEESDNNSEYNEEIVGMSLNEKKKATKSEEPIENKLITSGKDLKKAIKKATLQQVKKSKAFKRKQQVERRKNKKESMRKQKQKEKVRKHSGKLKNKLKQ
ncbi:nucleolar protein viriato [Megachile rotundata]|uniref:nucleolar protein viriato n=1 Tax=Megachile rotundata TaxID=143995 RepID=UPI000614ED72|nr:PREDICTED: nucleolar protein 12 [Megachile rotundata]XP_012144001.1 PREDICTED: nucleolar protein 12 [Megachile rotundata]XP_012144002.1 PREDICTED: nucleolar protein 12 [Megachile rotundata]